MSGTDNQLELIRAAYREAARELPAEYSKLPAWRDLPIELREAMIHIYSAGRRAAGRS